MPYYKYRAKKGIDQTIEGILEAENKEDAVSKINTLGLIAVRLEEVSAPYDSLNYAQFTLWFSRKISLRQINIFSSQLSSLIKSGVPLLRALGIIIEQTDNLYFKDILGKISQDVKVGRTFSEALAGYPAVFPPLYLAIIKAGEVSGTLDAALDRISVYLRNKEDTLSKIRNAMIYPLIMGLVGLATFIFMLVFVIPKLKDAYLVAGGELPLPTQILLSISGFLRANWLFGLIILFCLFVFGRKFFKKRKELAGAFLLKIPMYGKFLLKSEIAQLCRTLELLLTSGVKILSALELAAPVLSNEIIKRELLESGVQIKEGGSLGRGLKNSKVLPAFMINFITIGEESGKLNEIFKEIADYYERDTADALKIFTAQLEPIMILAIGLIMGFVVMAMLLPIFQLNMMVK